MFSGPHILALRRGCMHCTYVFSLMQGITMVGLSTGERREVEPGPRRTADSLRSLSSMSTRPELVPVSKKRHLHMDGESWRGAQGSKGHFPFCSKETHFFYAFSLTPGTTFPTYLVEELFPTPSFPVLALCHPLDKSLAGKWRGWGT